MSLQRSSLLFVVLSVAAFVGATQWVVDGLVTREATRVEREQIAREVARVRSLATGMLLDEAFPRRLETLSALELHVTPLAETPFEEEELDAREALAGGAPSFVIESGAQRISGYGLLDDIHGRPAFVLRVSGGRELFQSGRRIVRGTMLALLAGGLLLGLATWWVLRRGVLRPLRRLQAGARRLGRGEHAHVVVRGGDEFQALAREFNRMSDALEERADEPQVARR
jgi:HAMP domain-containing protein